jgi:hypothetical protein
MRHGKAPPRPPLPPLSAADRERPGFIAPDPEQVRVRKPTRPVEYDPDVRELLDRAQALDPIVVPASLRNPHRLVSITREFHEVSRQPYDRRDRGRLEKLAPGLAIDVSDAQFPRALRIMDALIKAIERLGGRVKVETPARERWRTVTVIRFCSEVVTGIRIREKRTRVRRAPERSRRSWGPTTELVYNGPLVLDPGIGSFEQEFCVR